MEETEHTPDPLIGRVFAGKYRILARIGTGGMSGVYRAEHVLMNRVVALKLLPKQLADDPVSIKRFEAEARIASQVSHVNAVTLYDFGVDDEVPYLVLEYIEGRTLRELLAEHRPLSIAQCFKIMDQICAALADAHELGIIHRDIKPSNIMFRGHDPARAIVKVLDFGIAKVVNQAVDASPNITVAGTIVGTPHYMSPEQGLAKELDSRSDVYSLGIVLYEMLCGVRPFEAPSTLELLMKHVNTAPTPLKQHSPELKIPDAVEAVVMRCLEKDPANRFQTVTELAEALRKAASDVPDTATMQAIKPVKTSKPIYVVGTLAAAALLALIIWPAPEPKKRNTEVVAPPITAKQEILNTESAEKLEAIQAELKKQAELAREADEARRRAMEEAEAMRAAAEDEATSKEQLEALQAELARQAEAAKLAEAERLRAIQEAEALKKQTEEDVAKKLQELEAKFAQQAEEAKKAAEAEDAARREAEALKQKSDADAAKKLEALEAELAKRAEEAKRAAEAQNSARQEAVTLKQQTQDDATKKLEQLQAELARQAEEAKKAAAAQEAAKRESEAMKRALEEKDRQMKLEIEKRARERKQTETRTVNPTAPKTYRAIVTTTVAPIVPEATAQKRRKRCGPNWCM